MSTTKYLIVNADEFGLTEQVNQGIIEAHQKGVLTSTTFIVNMWSFEDAVALANANPTLATGLHLNLTDGAPISNSEAVSSLVDTGGRFHHRGELLRRLIAGRIKSRDVREELRAQIGKLHAAGISPTHLDSHQSTFMFPTLFRIVVELAAEHQLPIRLPQEQMMFHSTQTLFRHLGSPRLWKKVAMWSICEVMRRGLERRGIPTIRRVASTIGTFENTHNNSITLDTYQLILRSIGDGISELMTHPGYADDRLASFVWGGWPEARRREQELAVLCDSRLSKMIASQDIQLINYRTVTNMRSQKPTSDDSTN